MTTAMNGPGPVKINLNSIILLFSTHTVIHRPDVLVEIESSQTRSLYGTVEGQESNLPRPGFDESNTQGIEVRGLKII